MKKIKGCSNNSPQNKKFNFRMCNNNDSLVPAALFFLT